LFHHPSLSSFLESENHDRFRTLFLCHELFHPIALSNYVPSIASNLISDKLSSLIWQIMEDGMPTSTKLVTKVTAIIVLLASLHGGAFGAEQKIQFNSAGIPPSKFKIKRAKAKGIVLKTEPGAPLLGKMFRPEGKGPFPAIIMIHGCRGIQPYQKDWAQSLAKLGYLSLIVDSFTTRDEIDVCKDWHDRSSAPVVAGRSADAAGAYDYLIELPFVKSARIALLGWSRNGVLAAISDSGLGQVNRRNYRAAIAFYPGCGPREDGIFMSPLLVLLGENDDTVTVKKCRVMAKASNQREYPVELAIYQDAEHAFDDKYTSNDQMREDMWTHKKESLHGVMFKYNAVAHADAEERVEKFLDHHLNN
jgi:dienelactone hydrolase